MYLHAGATRCSLLHWGWDHQTHEAQVLHVLLSSYLDVYEKQQTSSIGIWLFCFFFFCSTATFLFERFTATYCSNFRFIDVKLNSLTSSYAVHGSGWFMELDDSEMSRWCLETARKGDVSDVMKTLEALLLRTCGQDRLTLSSWTRQSAKLRDKKKFLVKRLLDLLCKQMLQFHSSYISYKQYVDTHISWLASLSLWALPGMAAHRATVSEKKGAKSVYASFVVSIRSWKTISIHFIHCIYLLKHVGGIKRHSKQKLQKPMEICTCCPTLKARFLAKLHRRRFNRACVAHPWDAQAQLVGDSFPGFHSEVEGQNCNGEVLKNWWIGWWMKWRNEASRLKMLDLVMSEICWSERNRYLSKKRWFCAARRMSWWPVVLPWGLEPTLAWWRRSDFFHPTFHLLDVLRSSCGITILKTKWSAPPVLSDYCSSNSFFDWHCQKCRGLQQFKVLI